MMRATSPTSCRALAPQMRPRELDEDLMVDISMVHSDININIYIYCIYIVIYIYIYTYISRL